MNVFRIVGMSAAGHFRPNGAQAGITEALESNFGGVVTDDGVIAEHLEKFAAGFGGRLEFGFVGEAFEEALLLIRAALQKFMTEFGLASRIDPMQPRDKAMLGVFTGTNRIGGGAEFIAGVDGNTIGEHEVDELGDSGIFGAGSVVGRNNHFGETLDEAELIGVEE